ncbi:ABC transporter substrate-binding protein [Paenibacillus filicis]|uniref:ABC transporter substrate-binding protein n=1 Tax=Paenibacillus filicis TaxID=669464 RepID=A0ABU9DGE5_9BACL
MNKSIASSWLKVVTLSVVLTVVLSACSGGKAELPASTAKQAAAGAKPVPGGELTYALATSPDTLDPAASGFAVSHRVFRNIFDSLVFQQTDGTYQPWLATSWTKSDDGKAYTFKLRQDVKFQDGTSFNAAAVKANFDHLGKVSGQARSLLGPVASSEVVDEFTIRVNLSKKFEPFLSGLSSAFFGISSPKALQEFGDQYGKHPVGTGPFKFVKWTENSEIVLEKSPDYNSPPPIAENKGASYLDKLTFKIVPEEATRIGSVQSGQVLAGETVPPQNIASLKSDPKFKVHQAITNGTAFSLYLNTRSETWKDLKARQAIQLAVDPDLIVKTLYLGAYPRAWASLTPGVLGYNASLENKVKPDVAKANQLLDELGWKKGADGIREKDGKKLTLRYLEPSPNREKRNDIAVIVQQQLKELGVSVVLNITKDTATPLKQGDYDLFGNSQVKADPDILTNLFRSDRSYDKGGTNWSSLNDPQIDKLLDEGSAESDPQKRKAIYEQIQQYLHDNAIIIPIYVFPYTVAQASKVEGLKFDLLGYPLFYDVSIRK